MTDWATVLRESITSSVPPREAELASIISASSDWAHEALKSNKHRPPDIPDVLVQGLPNKQRRSSIAHAEAVNDLGIELVKFEVSGPRNDRHTRFVLPAHFVIMRTLELVAGVTARM